MYIRARNYSLLEAFSYAYLAVLEVPIQEIVEILSAFRCCHLFKLQLHIFLLHSSIAPKTINFLLGSRRPVATLSNIDDQSPLSFLSLLPGRPSLFSWLSRDLSGREAYAIAHKPYWHVGQEEV